MAIDFPTDSITIRQLLEIEGHQNWESLSGSEVFQNLEAAISIEREIAQIAFRSAVDGESQNLRTTKDGLNLNEVVEMLDADYQRFGLSSGQHQTNEHIRRIQEQVVAQVNQRQSPN